MSLDERALLAAITADPADDTARLVYADWLDEHDRPARAEFIRAQVETGRHHPNSTRRAELDARARALLAEHWVDWWTPVCEAVGLPVPKRQRASRLGRFAQTLRLAAPEGRPYQHTNMFVTRNPEVKWASDAPAGAFAGAEFRRGFPDTLSLMTRQPGGAAEFLARWAAAAPLDGLSFYRWSPESWADGPYLRGLRALTVDSGPGEFLTALADSCHLDRLEEVSILGGEEAEEQLGGGLSRFLPHPLARQLRRLSLPVTDQLTAQSLAGAVSLSGLTSLSIELQNLFSRALGGIDRAEVAAAGNRLADLARSSYLAGLTELKVRGVLDPAGGRVLSISPTWAGLRRLTLELWAVGWEADDVIEVFLADAILPTLEELRLECVALTPRLLDQLARSTLIKQLRHLSISRGPGVPSANEFRRFLDKLDPDQIETLTFVFDQPIVIPGADELNRRFGDRLRILQSGSTGEGRAGK